MAETYPATASAGTLRGAEGVSMAHAWTTAGVQVEGPFTGANVLHPAVAGCVLNDVYREAYRLGLAVDGVRVRATGGPDESWGSRGIGYAVTVDSELSDEQVAKLLEVVEDVAEIPRALRVGSPVKRVSDG